MPVLIKGDLHIKLPFLYSIRSKAHYVLTMVKRSFMTEDVSWRSESGATRRIGNAMALCWSPKISNVFIN